MLTIIHRTIFPDHTELLSLSPALRLSGSFTDSKRAFAVAATTRCALCLANINIIDDGSEQIDAVTNTQC